MGKDADPITTAEKRHVARDNLGHERQTIGLDPGFDGVFFGGIVADTARPAANNDTRVLFERQLRKRLLIQPQTMNSVRRQPALSQEGLVFAIRRLVLGTKLNDQEPFHAPSSACSISAIRSVVASIPTDSLTRPSPIPSASRWSCVNR